MEAVLTAIATAPDYDGDLPKLYKRVQGHLNLSPESPKISARKVEIAGIASSPSGLWMNQIGRNLTDAVDGLLNGKRYLIHDRDPLFTAEFLSLLGEAGVASVKLPPRSPNLGAP